MTHSIVLALLRGFLPTIVHTFGEGGSGSFPALQALLVGPPAEPEQPQPKPAEPRIDPELVVPRQPQPAETTFGRRDMGGQVRDGKTAATGAAAPDINIAVGTISDPARLGSDYVAQLAQRFPNLAQKAPVLLGAPVVDYPRSALDKGIEGRFAAVVDVDALGKVTDVRLVKEDPMFGPAILEALKRMQFAPAQDGGTPVPYWTIVEFVFTIGKPEPSPAPLAGQASARRGIVLPQPPAGRR